LAWQTAEGFGNVKGVLRHSRPAGAVVESAVEAAAVSQVLAFQRPCVIVSQKHTTMHISLQCDIKSGLQEWIDAVLFELGPEYLADRDRGVVAQRSLQGAARREIEPVQVR
jgi:hypothetical protein